MKFNLDINDIKYIKILYANNLGNPVSTKAAIKSITDREITACIKYEDDFNIKAFQDVTLSFVCNDGLYRTKTKLKSYESEFPYIILYIITPQGLEYQQNREFFRVQAAFNCSYIVKINGQVVKFPATTADISANGVSIIIPTYVIPQKLADIEISMGTNQIRAKIQYVRCEKLKENYKLSFKFAEISARDRDFISGICIKKQLEQKRNNLI